jgi:hypothetical protein
VQFLIGKDIDFIYGGKSSCNMFEGFCEEYYVPYNTKN